MKKTVLFSFALLLSLTKLTAQDAWLNNVMGGFNNTLNTQSNGLHIFNSQLYTATGQDSGYVYRTSTGQHNSWEKAFSQPNLTSVNAINSTSGYMYVSGYFGYNYTTFVNPDSTVIYRSADGLSNWTPYFQFLGSARFIIPFKGTGTSDSVYVVKNGSSGSEIWKSAFNSTDPADTLNSWTQTLSYTGIGNYIITSNCIHTNKLYVGTDIGSTSIPTLWSSTDGNTWIQTVTTTFDTTQSISSMISFNGELYVGTENYNGAQIWKTTDEINWVLVGQYPANYRVTSLQVISGELWATLEGQSMAGNAAIIKNISSNPTNYSMNNGFGLPSEKGEKGSIIDFGNNIYYACSYFFSGRIQTGLTDGSQIWKLCLSTPPTVSLGPDQIICAGLTHTFDAGAGFSGYAWCDGSGNQTLDANYPQDYFVTVMGTNGCEAIDTVALKNIPSPTIYGNFYEIPPLCKGDTFQINLTANSNLRNNLPAIHHVLTTPLPIIDYQSSYDTLMVSGISNDDGAGNTLVSVTIDSLFHTNNSELSLNIISPSGSIITLANYGNGQNYIGTTFITNGISFYDGLAPYSGSFSPIDPFSFLSGSSNGAWVLQIIDNLSGNTGVLKGWSLTFSQIDTNVTFAYSPATGLSSTTLPDFLVYPAASATYAIAATNGTNACTSYDSIRVIVPGIKINPHAAGICSGYSDSLSADLIGLSPFGQTYPATPHWSNNAGLIDTIAFGLTITPNSTTSYYVMDTIANCYIQDSTIVIVSPLMTIDAGLPQTICFGDSASLIASVVSGGTSPYAYTWDDGGNYYYGQSIIANAASSYTLTVSDSFACTATNSTSIQVNQSTDISGHVSSSLGNVNNGIAVIYKYIPFFSHFDTVGVSGLDGNGDYLFTGINYGNYLIKIVADTLDFPSLEPTYYGNKWAWDSATVIVHGCDSNDIADIFMNAEAGTGGGTGFLRGQIVEGPGFGRIEGGPIPGVDVKLGRNPGGIIISSGTTDNNGYYTFNGVSYGNYTVYVDIPGLGTDSSYTVDVDASTNQFLYLDYHVDSTSIYITPNAGVGISNPSFAASTKFNVFPNPSKGNATIEYEIAEDVFVSLEVYDVLGIKINTFIQDRQSAGAYKFILNKQNQNLTTGVYFITLTIDGKSSTQRIVVME